MVWIHKFQENIWVQRILLLVFAASFLALGVATLKEGRVDYRNYFGGRVFAPFAIALGIFLLVLLLLKWKTLNKPEQPLKGKARRKAEKAKDTKFPVDDFDEMW